MIIMIGKHHFVMIIMLGKHHFVMIIMLGKHHFVMIIMLGKHHFVMIIITSSSSTAHRSRIESRRWRCQRTRTAPGHTGASTGMRYPGTAAAAEQFIVRSMDTVRS